jgi:PPM family protein phosphatase
MPDSPPREPLPPCLLRWSGLTDRGRVRANNEDTFLALAVGAHGVQYLGKVGESPLEGMDFVFAVCDGMGGAKAGEFASRVAVDRIPKLVAGSFQNAAMGLSSGFTDILAELVAEIHSDLLRLGSSYEECDGMGTTLSLGWLTPGWLYFAHVGDSRIYYLPRDGGMVQVTHDHTHAGWQRRTGRMNEREQRAHPSRHALHQVLGAGQNIVDPHIGAVGFEPGDRFVFCTDGLVDGLWDRRIQELVRSPEPELAMHPIAQRLVQQAVAESGRDNTTALAVEILPAAAQP